MTKGMQRDMCSPETAKANQIGNLIITHSSVDTYSFSHLDPAEEILNSIIQFLGETNSSAAFLKYEWGWGSALYM